MPKMGQISGNSSNQSSHRDQIAQSSSNLIEKIELDSVMREISSPVSMKTSVYSRCLGGVPYLVSPSGHVAAVGVKQLSDPFLMAEAGSWVCFIQAQANR